MHAIDGGNMVFVYRTISSLPPEIMALHHSAVVPGAKACAYEVRSTENSLSTILNHDSLFNHLVGKAIPDLLHSPRAGSNLWAAAYGVRYA